MQHFLFKERSNMTTRYKIGSIHNTPKGQIQILQYIPGKRLPYNKRQHPRVVIRFIKSGWVANVQTTNIATGHITDYRAKTVYDVGYLDTDINIPMRGSSTIRRAYDLWANMLKRCYQKYKGCYKNCRVDKRWHSFKNFLNSLPELPGYDAWERGENVHLDKDTRVKNNRLYSKDTCQFIPARENVVEALNRRWHRE